MNKNRNQNILLVEIMIAVLFFALCSTVMLETFVASREYGRRSRCEMEALIEMQNMSERLWAAEDATALFEQSGYRQTEGTWILNCGEYVLEATLDEEVTNAGVLRNTLIRALREGTEIAAIPGARYLPGGGTE